ncbi:protein kinase family protein [Metabacillus arenae]|uniref:Protein kinase family protein n=1 Tax=Metabacillus arenae TaxID=2771434 RepID=A0A926NCJ5_9BACI|nr:protein kinase family protein [Metabacillus arenae]MBD1379044.1 protein kinase family protein [Metabacillus arenae]
MLFKKYFQSPLEQGFMLHNTYVIKRLVGEGAYGFSYLAEHINNGHEVLIKQQRLSKGKKGKRSFLLEAEILQKLNNHPNVPSFYELFETDNMIYLVMEFIKGKTFEEVIFDDLIVFNEEKSFKQINDILNVLQLIHEKNIVHRDLRIPNILLDGDRITIIDFGLAANLEIPENEKFFVSKRKKLFRERSFQSDFYGLGHFLLFLLYSGYVPSSSAKEKSWNEELSLMPEAQKIIGKMLQLEPPYRNCKELKDDIEMYLNSIEVNK